MLARICDWQMEEERTKFRQSESSHKEMSMNWLKERDDLKKQIGELRTRTEECESSISAKDKKI